ncbi:TATA-box-binding protein [Halorubrum sp. AJ67]|nr:TATA-box-binding protein [Halorubrum sp. AJ67]
MDTQLMETISTENVVASTTVGQELDLNAVSQDLLGVEYDTSEFPGVVYRTQHRRRHLLSSARGRSSVLGQRTSTLLRNRSRVCSMSFATSESMLTTLTWLS